MRVILPSMPEPGEFVYDSANPTRYTEQLSHSLSRILYELSQNGFTLDDSCGEITLVKIDKAAEYSSVSVYPSVDTIEWGE